MHSGGPPFPSHGTIIQLTPCSNGRIKPALPLGIHSNRPSHLLPTLPRTRIPTGTANPEVSPIALRADPRNPRSQRPAMSLRAALENGETPPETWSSFMADIYRNKTPPVNTTYDFDKLEEKAREVTKDYHGTHHIQPRRSPR